MLKRILILALIAVTAGCGGSERLRLRNKVPAMPDPPPAVPKRVEVPLDANLADSARAELMGAFHSNDPMLRAHAVEALRQTMGNDARPQILKALDDAEPVVRLSGAMAAGELRLEAAHKRLLQLAHDLDPQVRVAAIFALHRLGDTRYSSELEKTAVDPDANVRGHTALVLGLLAEPSAVNILRYMRSDGSPGVRLQANESLWRLGDEKGLESLLAGSISGYDDERMISLLALAAHRDPRVVPKVYAELTYEADNPDDYRVPLVAAQALGKLGSDGGYGVALRGMKSKNPLHRDLAAQAFGAIGRTDAQDVLASLLKDNNPNVRLSAATGILLLRSVSPSPSGVPM